MPVERTYLDHSATTPLRPAAVAAMTRAFDLMGNPSSIHADGRAARSALDRARRQIAQALGADAKHVVFTSGATEALNTILRPSPAVTFGSGAKRTNRLLVLATEHSAALAGGGFTADAVEIIPVDANGLADAACLERRLGELVDDTGFAPVTVAIQLANSETGVIQPIQALSKLTDRFGAILICDAVGAVGKIPAHMMHLNVDALVISAHKFGGPQGIGALVLNGDHVLLNEPLLKGGGQERRQRSGTENLGGALSMAAALDEATFALDQEPNRIAALREKLEAGILHIRPDAIIAGSATPRVAHVSYVVTPGTSAETALIRFDLAGVSVSSGAACSSGKVVSSRVLQAMGMHPSLTTNAIRFSLGWTTSEADIDKALAAYEAIYGRKADASGLAA